MIPEQEKRKQFREILLELAQTEDLLKSEATLSHVYACLEETYCYACGDGHFRHFYSDVFAVLSSIKKEMRPGTVDILGQNIKILYEQYKPSSSDKDISKELRKLYDHVSLDIARMSYADSGDNDISKEPAIKEIQEQVRDLRAAITTAHVEQERVRQELSNQQREYVAILGIFAAVVLAFTGGLAFSSSVLTNIDKVSTGKLMMIALTIGVVLISLLFGLFHYIEKLVNISMSPKDIKPLWGYMFVIVMLMLVALFLCHCPVFDTLQATINLNMQF